MGLEPSRPAPTTRRKAQQALMLLESVSQSLGLSQEVVDECVAIIRRLGESKTILPWFRVEVTVGGVIHSVALAKNININLREISNAVGAPETEIYQMSKRIMKTGVVKKEKSRDDPGILPITYQEIQKLSSALGVSSDIETLAKKLAETVANRNPSLIKTPRVTAAIMIYIASVLLNQRIAIEQIAKTAGRLKHGLQGVARRVIRYMARYIDINVYV